MKNNLEDQLKNAFDGFEPEVDPSLWTKISTQLPTAPAPVSTPPVQTGLFSSGSLGAWIAGTAAVIVAATGIYFATRTGSDPIKAEDKIVNQEISVEQSPSKTVEENTDLVPVEPSKGEAVVVEDGKKAETSDMISGSQSPTVVVKQEVKEVSSAHSNAEAAPVTAPKAEVPAGNSQEQKPAINSDNVVPFRLITNVKGGFAPLSLTVLTNQPGVQAEFDFGDGMNGRGQSLTHIYKSAGLYELQGAAANQQHSQEIEVLEPIPTAFSPNGDGTNDEYIIENSDIRELEIKIYNRAGRIAFTGKGSIINWNGLYSDGRQAETGTYFYDIFVTSNRGNLYKQKGTITLFR
jgi:gliding motility-associated-like protein